MTKTVFEKSQMDQHAYSLPKNDPAFEAFSLPDGSTRTEAIGLPELSELDITRHFSELAQRNCGIDNLFYPLGSCTMKLNPRINEYAAALPGFSCSHPLADDSMVQGNLAIGYEFGRLLADLCGMGATSLVPNAGAQGEYTGVQMIAAYHADNGDHDRNQMLIPDNAHGTNPATARMAGFETITIRSDANGDLDIQHLHECVSDRTAGLMLTNPNTLGVFSPKILEITKVIHEAGGLLYYDGANLNAILELARPGDMGFDVMHINLHKTFSTPHGGGGPGSGPVCCNARLEPYLPTPRIFKEGSEYRVQWNNEKSIGRMASFHGNFGIYLRAYLYTILHGKYGLRRIADNAVLNANYLKVQLANLFTVPYPQPCMHEFVIQADNYLDKGIKALDIAKRMLDYGIYAPTIYFPLIIKECMLIEPTECESKATLDRFIEIMQQIVEEIIASPQTLLDAPATLMVGRLDEVRANRRPVLRHAVTLDRIS
ncbi:Probable glycine dehydrogenase (decarboxylating) subunit 2 [Chlamydiales bacterium SCGC AG-110-P3]|nr:Probable glycine dehydrogenase (decarboxylating) subunit 2 [Chlamydiales bacterium SCGC AG-110-P3]